MNFKGYREDHLGYWFSSRSTSILSVHKRPDKLHSDFNDYDYYVINEQENYLIKINDNKQKELLYNCIYGTSLTNEEINWLKDETKGKFKYFESAEEFIIWHKELLDSL